MGPIAAVAAWWSGAVVMVGPIVRFRVRIRGAPIALTTPRRIGRTSDKDSFSQIDLSSKLIEKIILEFSLSKPDIIFVQEGRGL